MVCPALGMVRFTSQIWLGHILLDGPKSPSRLPIRLQFQAFTVVR